MVRRLSQGGIAGHWLRTTFRVEFEVQRGQASRASQSIDLGRLFSEPFTFA